MPENAPEGCIQTILLSLGSNLGDRNANITFAFERLKTENGINLICLSDIIETRPVGPKQPDYLNAAVLACTSLSPDRLLEVCRKIESDNGRIRSERWGARTLDIDIVLYSTRIIDTPTLRIPHPEFRNRLFVLEPAAQIAPDMIDPETGKSLLCLLQEMKRKNGAT